MGAEQTIKRTSRQEAIEEELGAMGYRMEHSLAALEGDEGHAIIEISTGDNVAPPNEVVLRLAEEWSSLEGCVAEPTRADGASDWRVTSATDTEHELLFTVGTGDGWNCQRDDGLGIHLSPVFGGQAWDWSATRAWWNGCGTGQAPTREAAVAAAINLLHDHGLDTSTLPHRDRPSTVAFSQTPVEWSTGQQRANTRKQVDAAHLADAVDAICDRPSPLPWARKEQLRDAAQRLRTVATAAMPMMAWVASSEALPPENSNVVVMLESGIPLLGRNLSGRFCQYDSINDRLVEWADESSPGFAGITRWSEVGTTDLHDDTCRLLRQASHYLRSAEPASVEQLAAAILRHVQRLAPDGALPDPQAAPSGYVLAFPGASDREAEELMETLTSAGTRVHRVHGAAAAEALRGGCNEPQSTDNTPEP